MGACASCLNFLDSIWQSAGLGGEDAPPRYQSVNGKSYQILHELGSGGLAVVYRARNVQTQKEFALKRIRFPNEKREVVDNEIRFLKMVAESPYFIKMIDFSITGGFGGSSSSSSSTTAVDVNSPTLHGQNEEEEEGEPTNSSSSSGKNIAAASSGGFPVSSPTFDCEAWIVLELCGLSIFTILQDKINHVRLMPRLSKTAPLSTEGLLTVEQIVGVLDTLVHGVGFLHSRGSAHFDVKPQNILVALNNNPNESGVSSAWKICDLGSATNRRIPPCANSKQINAASVIIEDRMTQSFSPPEAVDLWSRHSVDTKADMWSIGVSLYVMLCGKLPFEEGNTRAILDAKVEIPSSSLKPEFKSLSEICLELLQPDPQLRMNIYDLSKKLSQKFPSLNHKVLEPPSIPVVMSDWPLEGAAKK